MNTGFDPIRILYIDDALAQGPLRSLRTKGGGKLKVPTLDGEPPQSFFEVRWIASAMEAREFKERTRELASGVDDPAEGGPWVPEILCFDYALTKDPTPVEDRLTLQGDDGSAFDSLSPLPLLRRRSAVVEGVDFATPAPAPSGGVGGDVSGCYVGGTLLLTFSDHPCAPVPFTSHSEDTIKRSDASFYEWLIAADADFTNRGDKWEDWPGIFARALPVLRNRIQTLVASARVVISMTDLLRLAESKTADDILRSNLVLRSRFGVRRMPVAGLWSDIEISGELVKAVNGWAQALLDNLSPHSNHLTSGSVMLRQAYTTAEHIWEAYEDDELVSAREQLSLLLGSSRRSAEDETKLDTLRDYFAVHGQKCTAKCRGLHGLALPDRVKRWAALMVAARLVIQWLRVYEHPTLKGRALLPQLNGWDLLLALNPVPSFPAHLFFHRNNKKTDVRSNAWSQAMLRWEDGDQAIGLNVNQLFKRTAELLLGERALLRSYSLAHGLDSTKNSEHCFWEE